MLFRSHGIRVVKSFVREEHETEKFKSVSGEIQRDFTKAEKILAFNSPMMQAAIYVCLILICWFSAKAIVGSAAGVAVGGIYMTTGNMQNLLSYSMMILMSLMMLSLIYVMIMMSRESVNRISEVLEEKVALKNPEHPKAEIKSGDIVFENVGFSYTGNRDKLCLSDVNIHIHSVDERITRAALPFDNFLFKQHRNFFSQNQDFRTFRARRSGNIFVEKIFSRRATERFEGFIAVHRDRPLHADEREGERSEEHTSELQSR